MIELNIYSTNSENRTGQRYWAMDEAGEFKEKS